MAGDCPQRGYLLVPAAIQAMEGGDAATAYDTFTHVAVVAARFGNPLTGFGRLGHGQALIRLGESSRGLTMLDEAMVAVTAGEVSTSPPRPSVPSCLPRATLPVRLGRAAARMDSLVRSGGPL